MSFPKTEPIKLKEYTTKQSKYPQAAKLPIRSIVLGPSGSGKTILLQNFIMDICDGCFDKIYVFSPSVHLDHTWLPVKEYVKEKMKQDIENKDDPMFFDEYEPEHLARIIDTQRQITDYMKKQPKTQLFCKY